MITVLSSVALPETILAARSCIASCWLLVFVSVGSFRLRRRRRRRRTCVRGIIDLAALCCVLCPASLLGIDLVVVVVVMMMKRVMVMMMMMMMMMLTSACLSYNDDHSSCPRIFRYNVELQQTNKSNNGGDASRNSSERRRYMNHRVQKRKKPRAGSQV